MTELIKVNPQEFGIEEQQAKELTKDLGTILKEREVLTTNYEQLIQLEVTPESVPYFAELRKQIKKNRTSGIEAWHKRNKAYFLAGGRFVDAIKNKETEVNLRMEEMLENAEKHFERLEAEAKDKIRVERYEELSKYTENAGLYPLADISEEAFQDLLKGQKLAYEQKQKAIEEEEKKQREEAIKLQLEQSRKMELMVYSRFIDDMDGLNLGILSEEDYNDLHTALKEAKEEDDKEQERIKAENEKLRIEAEKKQKELDAERKAATEKEAELKRQAEAKLAEERRQAQEREAELQRKINEQRAEAERIEKEKRERIEAKERAEAELRSKSEAEQITAWINQFSIPNAPFNNPKTQEIVNKFNAFKVWAANQVTKTN
jgi:colicin import membrane protein